MVFCIFVPLGLSSPGAVVAKFVCSLFLVRIFVWQPWSSGGQGGGLRVKSLVMDHTYIYIYIYIYH